MKEGLRIATAIAARQDGLVRHRELTAAGVGPRTIERLSELGSLQRVVWGIYLVGHPVLSSRALRRSALMLAGPSGALAARTALEWWRVLDERPGIVNVQTVRSGGRTRVTTKLRMADGGFGLVTLRRVDAPPPVAQLARLAVTTVPRALIDLAGSRDAHLIDRAWRQSEFRGLLDEGAIRHELARSQRPGVSIVRGLVDGRRILTTPETDLRSPGELPWWHRIVAAGLQEPEVNVPMMIAGQLYVADFYWRDLGLILELDTPDHLTPSSGARDRLRDFDFFLAGLYVLRFLESEANADPDGHLARLRAALELQRRRVA